jgi:high-affinity nickel-transport protein
MPVTASLIAILILGFVLGMRHATDADHVVAVTTIVSRERTWKGAILIGGLWGLGHTATILLVGGAIIAFGVVIPERVGLSLELPVAVMLVVLGAMNFSGALSALGSAARSAQTGVTVATKSSDVRGYVRPIVVGAIHGLAGSAAVALLVLTTIREVGWAMLYLALFGLGTSVGMMALTLIMSVPLSLASDRFANSRGLIARATGLVSILFGLFLVYQIGFVEGLLIQSPN